MAQPKGVGEQIDPQEILEFPCLMVDSENFSVVSTFHQYVKPVGVPNITPFCTELTGITQDMVEAEPTWEEVLEMFVSWYTGNNLSPLNSTFVTCGLWDLKTVLPKQCQYSQIAIPEMLDVGSSGEYINIKYSFQKHTGTYAKGLPDMQRQLDLQFEGRHHSGIDDCKNILNIMEALARKGFVFDNNAKNIGKNKMK